MAPSPGGSSNGLLTFEQKTVRATLRCLMQVLKILKETHEWLRKDNEAEVRKTLESRGWLAAFDLQTDVPYPETVPLAW